MESIRLDKSNQDVFSYGTKVGYRDLDMNNYTVKNLREPAQAQEVATKTYVDNSTTGGISGSDDLNFNSLSLNGTANLGTNRLNVNGATRLGGNTLITGKTLLGEIEPNNVADNRVRYITMRGDNNRKHQFIRFRRGGGFPEGDAGACFSSFDGNNFYMFNDGVFHLRFSDSLINSTSNLMRSSGSSILWITTDGDVGVGNTNPQEKIHVNGNILASGTISGASKHFIIEHPNPTKKDTHNLIHTSIETNTRGTCFYEFNAYVEDSYILNLPSYFKYLICDDSVKCYITPIDELCMVCYKKIDNQNIQIRTSAPCNVSILVSGVRKDEKAIELWKGDEVLKAVKDEN